MNRLFLHIVVLLCLLGTARFASGQNDTEKQYYVLAKVELLHGVYALAQGTSPRFPIEVEAYNSRLNASLGILVWAWGNTVNDGIIITTREFATGLTFRKFLLNRDRFKRANGLYAEALMLLGRERTIVEVPANPGNNSDQILYQYGLLGGAGFQHHIIRHIYFNVRVNAGLASYGGLNNVRTNEFRIVPWAQIGYRFN